MNLIELENLVKAVPDEYLTKEVQQPTGKIPPFLALSEIQRRKDMRDRYQAQQGAVEKPTIAEQIVGGIGSLPQPQVGAPPAPAMPGGMGAPPVAAGAAPMPTPPGIPQGFAAGGLVGYAGGGGVPVNQRLNELRSSLAADERITGPGTGGILQRILREGQMPMGVAQRMLAQKEAARLQSAQARLIAAAADQPIAPPTASAPASAPATPATPAARPAAPAARPSTPAAGAPAPTGQGSAAPRPASKALGVQPGGLGDLPATEISPIPTAAPAVAASGVAPAPGNIPPTKYESQAEAQYAKMLENKDLFTLPEAINYDEFIQAAGKEEAAIRAAAKQEALGAALVQLGAGLAAGNMAAGLSEAGQQAQQVMKEGRRDAAAQKALAQELKLRGMEGKREQAIQQSKMTLEGAGLSAGLARDTRREQEERAYRDQQTAIAAAERQAARADRARSFDLSLKQYNLEMRRDAAKTFDQFLENEIGPPPSAKEYSDWQKLPENMRGPDPRQSYIELRKQAAPSAAARTQRVYPEIELSFYGAAASAGDRKAQREAREKDYKYQRPPTIRGNITKAHIQYLRANPSQRDAFNQKFGKGWAEYYLDN